MGCVILRSEFSYNIPGDARQQNFGTLHTAWIPTAYLIAGGIVGLPIGRLASRIGSGNAFAIGILTYLVGALLVSVSSDYRLLIFSFFAMGAGSAMLTVTGRSLLWNVCGPEEREMVYSILITIIGIGTLSGSFLGGLIIHSL